MCLLEKFTATEVLSASQAHNCFRFLITSPSLPRSIVVVLLNWDGYLKTSEFPPASGLYQSKADMVPVLKVAYRLCGPPGKRSVLAKVSRSV